MFKDKLKELRTKKGITQKELADKIFVSRSTIAKWENGNGYPSEISLESLCTYFGVEEDWLMKKNDDKNNIKLAERKGIKTIQIITITIPLIIIFTVLIFRTISITKNEQKHSFL